MSDKVYTITFDTESPIRTVSIPGDTIKYPDSTCEHTHAIVYSSGGAQTGSFDTERAVVVVVTR